MYLTVILTQMWYVKDMPRVFNICATRVIFPQIFMYTVSPEISNIQEAAEVGIYGILFIMMVKTIWWILLTVTEQFHLPSSTWQILFKEALTMDIHLPTDLLGIHTHITLTPELSMMIQSWKCLFTMNS